MWFSMQGVAEPAPERIIAFAPRPIRATLRPVEAWGFIWLMFALKIPLALLFWLCWWAVHAKPDTVDESDGGLGRRRHRPRRPRPGGPRTRDPHGAEHPAPPARTRTTVVRGREAAAPAGRHQR
jgi:hypothetical protein